MQQATEYRFDTENYSVNKAYIPRTNILPNPDAVTWKPSQPS